MSERRRLKAGVEVQVVDLPDGDGVWCRVAGSGFWFNAPAASLAAFTEDSDHSTTLNPAQREEVWLRLTDAVGSLEAKMVRRMEDIEARLDLITEPIPEEPAGPKVGDEVTMQWLWSEYANGRYHVVRNPGGTAGSWNRRVEGTGFVSGIGRDQLWPLLALHPVERWEEPQPMPADTRTIERDTEIANLRSELQAVSDRVKELEALAQHAGSPPPDKNTPMEERRHAVTVAPGVMPEIVLDFDDDLLDEVLLASDDFNPKEVMPDAGAGDATTAPDVAPPPGAEQDAPGGDEPSVEDVLEWLDDIAGGWVATPGAKQPGAAARIIRERGEEIERLTERLTITDEKVEAAYKAWIRGPSSMQAWNAALRAAGMIDPEVGG